jgi:hypothetical protein
VPTKYVEFTYNPATAGRAAAICAVSVLGPTIVRRLTVQSYSSARQRMKLTRHDANASGGTTQTLHPLTDGGGAADTIVRVMSSGSPITWPNAANLVLTALVDTARPYSDNVIAPSDADAFSITAGHCVVVEFLDDHDAEYTIGVLIEEPSL